jgi:peptidoglycan hydrolase-like protein with peptidoglycan-binding domain
MNPELERRLRRFGATVDEAAANKDAHRTTAGAAETVAALDNVVAIGTRPSRTVHALVVAAAVVVIAIAGGIAVAITRSGPSTSTAERPATPTPAGVVETTEVAAAGPIESTAPTTTAAPVTTSTNSSRPESSVPVTRPTEPPVCRSYAPTNDYHLDICDSGAAVRLVQEQLQATVDSSLKVDGYFGPGTRAAVRTFQQLHDLTVDGQVGPATWALLVPEAPGTDTDHNGIVDPDEISTD